MDWIEIFCGEDAPFVKFIFDDWAIDLLTVLMLLGISDQFMVIVSIFSSLLCWGTGHTPIKSFEFIPLIGVNSNKSS